MSDSLDGAAGDFEVVVAAYGPSPYLEQTLTSVVANVPPNVRISVIDDASPEDSVRRVVDKFDLRVRYERNEHNLGTSGSFNVAMRQSQSRYTVLVGPDDLLLPGGATVYARAIRLYDGVAAIHPGVVTIDDTGGPYQPIVDRTKAALTPEPGLYSGDRLAARLAIGNWTYNPAIAWRSDLVWTLPFDEELHTAMDLDRLLRMAFAGESLALVAPDALAYRRHEGAVSSVNRGRRRLDEELAVLSRGRAEARRLGWRRTALAAELAPTVRSHALLLAASTPEVPLRQRAQLALAGLRPV